ncbi:MAG: hypothetical protein LBB23_04615 [Rickettsiales bacterium]|jgi:hypothetical protein|nr:hypothetical protein [Rickettsiales bacterium]
MSTPLERRFEQRIQRTIQDSKETGYVPTIFSRMVSEHGAVEACKRLVNDSKFSEGYTKLWELKRLDLSVENIILEREWLELFTDEERTRADKKLREYGFKSPNAPC